MTGNTASERFTGAFSVLNVSKVGAGTTVQKHVQTMYAYAEEQADGSFSLRYLNDNFVPVGKAWTVSREELLRDYTPEPDLYMNNVFPAMRELSKTVSRAERMRENGNTYSAEYEYKRALRIDETNIRATFGFGLTYLDRGDTTKADLVFRRLVGLEAAFEREHKHLFNEFGMRLRKAGLTEQALKYYARALEYSGEDEHLLLNQARVLADMGEDCQAMETLRQALRISPEFIQARRFLAWLEKRAPDAAGCAPDEDNIDDPDGME